MTDLSKLLEKDFLTTLSRKKKTFIGNRKPDLIKFQPENV